MKSLENESSVTTRYKESVSIMDYGRAFKPQTDTGMIHNVSRGKTHNFTNAVYSMKGLH